VAKNRMGAAARTLKASGSPLSQTAAILSLVCLASAAAPGARADDTVVARRFPLVGHIDPRFQAYNLDLIAITGMPAPPAKPASAKPADQAHDDKILDTVMSGVKLEQPLDLSNARLRQLARALGPAYLRTSGSSANSVFFQNDDKPAPAQPPAGFNSVLTRAQWKGVLDFAHAVDAKLLMSFTVNAAVRDASGVWTPRLAKPLADYTHAIGGDIYAAELFNEPNLPSYGGVPKGYDAAGFARDQVAFRAFAAKSLPKMKIVGPGDVAIADAPLPGGMTSAALMTGNPPPRFDIVSYHFYPAVSPRCAPSNSPVGASPDKALSEEWLGRTDKSFQDHKALRDRYAPGAPIWNTETAGAACSGAPWSATFVDSFRYVDQMGRLAKQGASAIFHQTLVGGNYGLLEPETFTPRPNYWAALLWRRTVGTTVLDAGPIRPDLHLYAHCQPQAKGGVTIVAINTGTTSRSLDLGGKAEVYQLTATELQSKTVLLNGAPLALGDKDAVPALKPQSIASGEVALAPTSITFIQLPQANNPVCR
jgi:heparanase 1